MTMHHITTTTLGSTGQLIIGSIPQTYTHLQLRISARSNHGVSNAAMYMGWYSGGDSPNQYSYHDLRGTGSSVTSAGNAINMPYGYFVVLPGASTTSNIFGSYIVNILDYTSTVKGKALKITGGYDANGSGVCISGGAIHNTLNPTTTFFIDSDTGLVAGTRVSVYGITDNPVSTGA